MRFMRAFAICLTILSGNLWAETPIRLNLAPSGKPLLGGTFLDVCQLRSGSLLAVTATGMFRTTNEGQEWKRLPLGAELGNVQEMKLCTFEGSSGTTTLLYSLQPDSQRLFSSTDEGNTWQRQEVPRSFERRTVRLLRGKDGAGLIAVVTTPRDALPACVMTYDGAQDADTVSLLLGSIPAFACAGDGTIWLLNDNYVKRYDTVTRSFVAAGFPADAMPYSLVTSGSRVCVLADAKFFGKAVYISDDRGAKWQRLEQAEQDRATDLSCLPAPDGSLLFHYHKSYVSPYMSHIRILPPQVTQWDSIRDVADMGTSGTGVALASGGYLLSTGYGHGPFLITADRQGWITRNTGLLARPIGRVFAMNEDRMVIATTAGDVYYRTQRDGEWIPATQNPHYTSGGGNGRAPWPVDGFALTPSGTLLAATRAGIYRSTDSGATWILAQASLFCGMGSWPRLCGNVSVRRGDPVQLLAAGPDGLLMSTDDGRMWEATSESWQLTCVTVTPSKDVYVVWGNQLMSYEYNYQMKPVAQLGFVPSMLASGEASDFVAGSGVTGFGRKLAFARMNQEQMLPLAEYPFVGKDTSILSALVLPDNTVLAATYDGVIGLRAASTEPQHVVLSVSDVLLDIRHRPDGGLVASSMGGEIFVGTVTTGAPDAETPGNGRVVPNPAVGTAQVHFGRDIVSAVVVDVLGRVVMDLSGCIVDGDGTFSVDGLPAGMYRAVGTGRSGSVGVPFVVKK